MMCNNLRAGSICGSPLSGLNRRECIEVNKVFDGCVFRTPDIPFTVTLTDSGAPMPWQFVSARDSGETTMSNLTLTPIRGRRHRVEFDSTTPIAVTYIDANGNSGVSPAEIKMHRSVLLDIPSESIIPYQIKTYCTLISTLGSINGLVCTFRLCLLQLVKVVAPVDLVVPSYGYCEYPFCREDACSAINSLELFPPPM